MKTFNLKVTLTDEELKTIVDTIASRRDGPVRDRDLRAVLDGCFDAGLEDFLQNAEWKSRMVGQKEPK